MPTSSISHAQVRSKYEAELGNDPFVSRHLNSFYDTLFGQNLLKLIEPYSRVQIGHIAKLINLPLVRLKSFDYNPIRLYLYRLFPFLSIRKWFQHRPMVLQIASCERSIWQKMSIWLFLLDNVLVLDQHQPIFVGESGEKRIPFPKWEMMFSGKASIV